jgi:hypothetical protein
VPGTGAKRRHPIFIFRMDFAEIVEDRASDFAIGALVEGSEK